MARRRSWLVLLVGAVIVVASVLAPVVFDLSHERRPARPASRVDHGRGLAGHARRDVGWLIQRAAAIVLLVAIALHLVNPFRRGVQAALLALVLLHALLGVRSLLLDVGLPRRWHRALLILALVLTAVLFAVVWRWRWY
jgi:succinate dehydrogenase hydrophobic anchor subunit